MEVVILQGIPGAGKSTWARNEQKRKGRVIVVSADEYMVDEHGNYKFDPAKLPECHRRCGQAFLKHLQAGTASCIIVDNTNTSVAEVAPYYALAQWFGVNALIYYWRANPENIMEQGARNIHGVPEPVLKAMHDRLEAFGEQMPPWWSRGVENHDGSVNTDKLA